MGKPVLFAATRPYGRAENMTALYESYDGEKCFIVTDQYRHHPAIKSGMYDVMVIDEFPAESPGKCILIWHAIQGGKKMGFDQPNQYYFSSQTKLIDYVIASGDGMVPVWERCSGVEKEKILPLGMARTDMYVGKKKGDGHTILSNKRAYLLVPTFRRHPEPVNYKVNFDLLDRMLTDDEILAVKAHTAGTKILGRQYKHIVELPAFEVSAPYLYDCDVVITDYSSILFDGYLLGKPCVLLEKGQGYTNTRGMYMNYPGEYSSMHCTDEQELIDLLRNANGLTETEKQCIQKVANACDGHACERINRLIHQMNGDD